MFSFDFDSPIVLSAWYIDSISCVCSHGKFNFSSLFLPHIRQMTSTARQILKKKSVFFSPTSIVRLLLLQIFPHINPKRCWDTNTNRMNFQIISLQGLVSACEHIFNMFSGKERKIDVCKFYTPKRYVYFFFVRNSEKPIFTWKVSFPYGKSDDAAGAL